MAAKASTYLKVDTFRKLLVVATILTGSFSPVRADTLYLKSGKKLEGAIVSQSRFQIRIRTAEGVKSLSKSSVRRLVYGGTAKPKPEPAEEKKPALTGPDPLAEMADLRKPIASKAGTAPAKELTPEMLAALRKKAEEERIRAEEERKRLERQRELERIRKEKLRRERALAKYRRDKSRANGALWRSALFPGWGQYHRGANRKAAYFGGAAAGTGALFFVSFQNYNQAVADFYAQSNLAVLGADDTALALVGHLGAEEAKARASVRGQQALFFAVGYLGVYIYNLFDVAVDRPTEPIFAPIESRLVSGSFGISIFDEGRAAKGNQASGGRRANRGLVFSYAIQF